MCVSLKVMRSMKKMKKMTTYYSLYHYFKYGIFMHSRAYDILKDALFKLFHTTIFFIKNIYI